MKQKMDSMDVRIIPEFNGSAESDGIVTWLERVELVCELRKIKDVVTVIPLRLAGQAYDVYSQIPAEDKKDLTKVKAALTRAFSIDSFTAFDKFKNRRLQADETVDSFLADLRRLATIFGGATDKILQCCFVSGLPERVRHTLRSKTQLESMTLDELLNRARIVIADVGVEAGIFAAATTPRNGPPSIHPHPPRTAPGCGNVHTQVQYGPADTPSYLPGKNSNTPCGSNCVQQLSEALAAARPFGATQGRRSQRRCYACNQPGHLAAACPKNGFQGTNMRQPSSPGQY